MKFTTPPNKNYQQDIVILKEAIQNRERITFSKFCDGEWAVLQNNHIDNKEFNFDPSTDAFKRKKLLDAFQYNNDRYFVGITCVNVFGIETHRRMKMISGLPEDRLTWADIWVNSNYIYFVNEIIPLFKNRDVVLFCNKRGKIENLPFVPYALFPVENNAWQYNWDYIDSAKTLLTKLKSQGVEDLLVLFCCGPFGNILAYELTKDCPYNTYLDIGSTLNPWLQSEAFKRDYYLGNNYFSNMVGAWDQ
jgi:hypothetical protein